MWGQPALAVRRAQLDCPLRHQTACQRRYFLDIHTPETEPSFPIHIDLREFIPRKLNPGAGFARARERAAQNPVIRLWTGCTRLKIQRLTDADFSLTQDLEGVKQDRSLTPS
jgi:hypothetical protein